uniref:F-box and WD repeat domain containing 7, E3 ubiquitin protein ligase n=1 Tax=Nothobranchius furzeri TaxID=105023 RepID=A0A1A8AXA2_NOTFU
MFLSEVEPQIRREREREQVAPRARGHSSIPGSVRWTSDVSVRDWSLWFGELVVFSVCSGGPSRRAAMGFYGTLKLIFYKMKRKLDHGPDGRPFPSGKKHCKGSGYLSPASLAQATPTTFGDLRLANGHSAQRRRVTSGPPPSGLQDWLLTFQTWSGPERLLALDELIDRCETSQVKHMMQVIEPQFQRDFISLLPKELALYVLTFLAPRDLLQAAQTCRYWRILAEDNLLWREKCREEGDL